MGCTEGRPMDAFLQSRFMGELLQPWHLVVFGVFAFLFFWKFGSVRQ
jgi:hypothetical protein